MSRSGAEIRSAVRRHARRRFRRQALKLALNLLACVLIAISATVALSVIRRPQPSYRVVLAVILLCSWGFLIAVLVTMLRPVRIRVEAKRLDDELVLKDRLTSALAFLDLPRRTVLEAATVADARRQLDAVTAHVGVRRSLRGPVLRAVIAGLIGCIVVGAAFAFRAEDRDVRDDALARPEPVGPSAPRSKEPNAATRTDDGTRVSDEDLVEVGDTTLADEALSSTFDAADLAAMQALGASDVGEADRLLAQAAYLNESDLSRSDAESGPARGAEDVMTMKEPDMDMIREMVKEAQERRKRGEDSDGGDDINLEVLIKSRSASSGRPPDRPQSGGQSPGAGGGPSQDTRIKPERVDVARKVEFKITSMRSLTPPGETDAKRIALSEAIMRVSGVPQPPLAKPRDVAPRDVHDASRPVFAQGVPAELRAYISRYFEGLKDLSETP